MNTSLRRNALVAVLAGTLVLVACGDDDDDAAASDTTEAAGEGETTIAGSVGTSGRVAAETSSSPVAKSS